MHIKRSQSYKQRCGKCKGSSGDPCFYITQKNPWDNISLLFICLHKTFCFCFLLKLMLIWGKRWNKLLLVTWQKYCCSPQMTEHVKMWKRWGSLTDGEIVWLELQLNCRNHAVVNKIKAKPQTNFSWFIGTARGTLLLSFFKKSTYEISYWEYLNYSYFISGYENTIGY